MSSEVGIDIIETGRIRNVLEKHPRRFLDRVYTEWEQMYCRTNILHLSGRWAAKEAVSKVLGLGVRGVGCARSKFVELALANRRSRFPGARRPDVKRSGSRPPRQFPSHI